MSDEITDDDFRSLLGKKPTDLLPPVRLFPDDGRIPTTTAASRHPIAEYFTKDARAYASSNVYASVVDKPSTFGVSGKAKNMTDRMECMFQFGHVGEAWPLPLAIRDYGGSGLSYPFSPLGYMLYHDRQNNIRLAMDDSLFEKTDRGREALDAATRVAFAALIGGSAMAPRYLIEVGTAKPTIASADGVISLRQAIAGNTDSGGYSALWCHMQWYKRLYADPSGEETAAMVLRKTIDQCSDDERVAFSAIAAAADDFGHRWKRGEWFSTNGAQKTTALLHTVLGVK